MNGHCTCSICCTPYSPDDMICFDDHLLCPSCLEEATLLCSSCDELIWARDNAGTEGTPLCQTCYDDHYTECDRCGCLIHLDDAFYRGEGCYCSDCDHLAQQSSAIKEYYYKPDPVFYGRGLRHFGVELEIDCGGEDGYHASEIMSAANADGHERLYIKHDGSLDEGFELVSHPMTLDYHMDQMPWPEILRKARILGYRSHQTNTCGLHIHVSRDALGTTEEEQESCIARILYFVEKHWEELLKFSRRTQRQMDHWAARYGYKEHPQEILDHAKDTCRGERYTCVNLMNADTIEFRMFRGTLKLNTILATLQLVDRVCDVALFLSDEGMKNLSWTTFAAGCQRPELVQYLKERRLYVNEPVTGEEEI